MSYIYAIYELYLWRSYGEDKQKKNGNNPKETTDWQNYRIKELTCSDNGKKTEWTGLALIAGEWHFDLSPTSYTWNSISDGTKGPFVRLKQRYQNATFFIEKSRKDTAITQEVDWRKVGRSNEFILFVFIRISCKKTEKIVGS